MTSSDAPSRTEVLTELGAASGLPVAEIEPDEELVGLGIDSVRLMRLVDGWQQRGLDVRFPDIAACATVDDVLALVAAP